MKKSNHTRETSLAHVENLHAAKFFEKTAVFSLSNSRRDLPENELEKLKHSIIKLARRKENLWRIETLHLVTNGFKSNRKWQRTHEA